MLATAALDYELPEELIATSPASPRDSARLMVLRRADPTFIAHAHVRDLPTLLSAGDVVVLNRTRVLPARFRGHRADTQGHAEGLFVRELSASPGDLRWHALLKLRRMKPGVVVNLETAQGGRSGAWLELIERVGPDGAPVTAADESAGGWVVRVGHDRGWGPAPATQDILNRVGLPPLPPYILSSRKRHAQLIDDPNDRDTYQTVFALDQDHEQPGRGEHGSVAAPTAGLHFTPELLGALRTRGIDQAEVLLHVGLGTFKPVETEFVEQHAMHSEWCSVPPETARRLPTRSASDGPESSVARTSHTPNLANARVVAVGTTTARTLESFSSRDEMLSAPTKDTRILITPGHHFKHVDALMTNFHLPRSTLLAMVAAFLDDDDRVRGEGLTRLLAAYRTAIEMGYRFYSFGDAMLFLP